MNLPLTLADSSEIFVLIAIGGGLAVVAIVVEALQKSAKIRQREQSRREIAAYVAEGTMTAEDGAKLLAAGESLKDKFGLKS